MAAKTIILEIDIEEGEEGDGKGAFGLFGIHETDQEIFMAGKRSCVP